MAVVSYPGVYVEEVSSGVRPIAAASTSVAAFIGQAERGPIGQAVKVFNFTEYQNKFGGFLSESYLSHAVYQFFNNGGTQCYVVRVTGDNTATADISLFDRAATPKVSLTIAAKSPGVRGNRLAVKVTDGSNDPGNELNLYVYEEEDEAFTLLESFENLSMAPTALNFVNTRVARSQFVVATVREDTNAEAGRSVGGAAPSPLSEQTTRMQVNVDADGYQEVDIKDAVAAGAAADLTPDNVAAAIQYVVRQLEPRRLTTKAEAFDGFSCALNAGVLELVSGTQSAASSVRVAPAKENDASAALNLGVLNGGIETSGGAVTRPALTPQDSYFRVGDNPPTAEVAAVTLGSDGDPVTTDQPYIDALKALDGVEDVSLIAVPGIGSTAVVGAGMSYCENPNHRPRSDCFFIGDMALDDDTIDEAKVFRAALTPKNSYGAVYLPWVLMSDPTGKSAQPIAAPPSGFVAGIYARTDVRRGVWKAPAGTAAALSGAVGLAADFTDVEQGNLNPVNVNVVRRFDAAGIVLWGARTVTSDAEWNYIPVRRMANLLKVSIFNGIQWAVFEPNDESLWSSLRLNVGAFMNNLYRQSAFQGATPDEAYFVKCDGETTTQADVDLGIVNLQVGFAPLKPAEFIVVRISQKAGQT